PSCKMPKLGRCRRASDTAASVDQGALALGQQVEEAVDRRDRQTGFANAGDALRIATEVKPRIAAIDARRRLDVLRHVDHDGTGPSSTGHFEGGSKRGLQFVDVGYEKCPFGARTHDVEDRRFLERIRTDGFKRYLSADEDDRYGVCHGVADRRHAVRG